MAWMLGAAMMLPTLAAAQDHRDDRHEGAQRNGGDRRQDDRRHDDRNRGDDHRDDHRGQDWNRGSHDRRWNDDHRQSTKNNWRNLGILGGAVGVAGLLTHNSTLAALGVGGGLYSAYRYDQDRKSQDRDGRGRYQLFSQRAFDHQGHHYERRERMKDGQKYYYFQRTR